MKITIGGKAPAFSLPDQDGKIHALKDYAGKWVLLYFYPKDDTPGCTTEACAFRDAWADVKKAGLTVLGASIDPPAKHVRFIAKYKLPFTLLSDVEKKLVEAYGVWGLKKFMGREYLGTFRRSFLIDPQGRIAKIYETVKPAEHATEVLTDLSALRK